MGPPLYVRSVVDRNVVMRRIPGTNVFNPLLCLRVMEGPRCATVTRFGLQNCLGLGSSNYVSFLRTASRVSGCYSWPGRDLGACLSITTLETPGRPFGDTGSVEPSSFLFVLCLLKLWQNMCMCVYAWKVSVLLCIPVTNQRKVEHNSTSTAILT
jgi:hypothetical protein